MAMASTIKTKKDGCLTFLCDKNLSSLNVFIFSNVINIMINAPFADLYKLCAGCADVLPRTSFSKNMNNKNGLESKCKPCRAAASKTYYHKHEAYRKNQIALKTHYCRERYTTNPQYKTTKILRNRLRQALKRAVNGKFPKKSMSTLKLLGCDMSFYMKHIEKQFKPGMTWENQGKIWHLDHRLPCASFDLTDPEQQKVCFSYLNMQPLWAIDNMKKGAKLDYHIGDANM